jgi:hypothetical protein
MFALDFEGLPSAEAAAEFNQFVDQLLFGFLLVFHLVCPKRSTEYSPSLAPSARKEEFIDRNDL